MKESAKNKMEKENKKSPDIQGLMKVKGKLMLVQKSPISAKQVLQIFQRTPAQHIYKRPGKGGQDFEYVTGVYVKKVLNYTFGWMWDFQIIDKGREGDQLWVHGRLTIKNPKNPVEAMIVKEQFGRAIIKFVRNSKEFVDYGNDLKAAATDALKKCASELGIASDIYGKQEFKELGIDVNGAPKAPAPVAETGGGARCVTCKKAVLKQDADYTRKIYGKVLCREHLPKRK